LNELSSLLEESSLFDKQETLQSEDEEESENARFGITLLLKNEVKKLNN
jgi:hypothetical protein